MTVFQTFLQQKNFLNFQILCVIVAMISCAAMCYAGHNVRVDEKYQPNIDEEGTLSALSTIFKFSGFSVVVPLLLLEET